MAMSRAQLVSETGGLLGQVLALAGLTSTDTTDNLREPVNAALRALGIAESELQSSAADLVPTGREQNAIAFARYYVLDRAVDALVKKMDVKGSGAEARLNQQVANLERQRDKAREVAESYGIWLTAASSGAYAGVFVAVGPR